MVIVTAPILRIVLVLIIILVFKWREIIVLRRIHNLIYLIKV